MPAAGLLASTGERKLLAAAFVMSTVLRFCRLVLLRRRNHPRHRCNCMRAARGVLMRGRANLWVTLLARMRSPLGGSAIVRRRVRLRMPWLL